MKNDPLDSLIVSEEEFPDSNLLASIVRGFMKFKNSGEILFEKPFFKQEGWKKILFYLLGRKIVFIKKLKNDFKEDTQPKEISQILGIEGRAVRTYLSRELKGIVESKKGVYKVPNYNLCKCEEVLKSDKTKRSD